MVTDTREPIAPEFRLFLDYWTARKPRTNSLPGRADLDPLDLPSLLPGMFLIDVVSAPGGRRFRYRLLGTEHMIINRGELTGAYVDDMAAAPWRFDPSWVAAVSRCCEKVVETAKPVLLRHTGPWPDRSGHDVAWLAAPLASDGRTVDMLAGFAKLVRGGNRVARTPAAWRHPVTPFRRRPAAEIAAKPTGLG